MRFLCATNTYALLRRVYGCGKSKGTVSVAQHRQLPKTAGSHRMPAVLHEGNQLGVGYPAMQPNQLGPLGLLAMLLCYRKQHLLQQYSSRHRISTRMMHACTAFSPRVITQQTQGECICVTPMSSCCAGIMHSVMLPDI